MKASSPPPIVLSSAAVSCRCLQTNSRVCKKWSGFPCFVRQKPKWDASQQSSLGWHLSIGLNAVLQAEELPTSISDPWDSPKCEPHHRKQVGFNQENTTRTVQTMQLDTTLADVDADGLTHGDGSCVGSTPRDVASLRHRSLSQKRVPALARHLENMVVKLLWCLPTTEVWTAASCGASRKIRSN